MLRLDKRDRSLCFRIIGRVSDNLVVFKAAEEVAKILQNLFSRLLHGSSTGYTTQGSVGIR